MVATANVYNVVAFHVAQRRDFRRCIAAAALIQDWGAWCLVMIHDLSE